MVSEMETDFARIDTAWEAEPATLQGALDYWDQRLRIRNEFLDGITDLEPPPEIAGTHAASLEIFGRITAADEALASRVAEYDQVTEHRQWLDTPEGAASLAILDEVFAFCRLSQEEFDATTDREGLHDAPWVPPEMKETVKVAFGCPEQ